MKLLLSSFVLLVTLQAADAAQVQPFGYVGLEALVRTAAPAPSFAAAPQDKLSKANLFVQCGRDTLLGSADTQAGYEEAVAFWKSILAANGITMGTPSFDHGTFLIPYKTADGSVIRDFWADPKQFKPKDEASLRENRALVEAELSKTHRIIASYVADLEFSLPTYKTYYLTRPDAVPDHETQLRLLGRGEDIDFDLLENAGVRVVQKPNSWMLVYIGPELGFVSRIGHTREETEKKMKDRMEYLTGLGKVMIGTRIHEISGDAEWKFLGNIYFYQ